MPIIRIEVPKEILDDAKEVSRSKSPEETLAHWLKRGHDTDENVHGAYEAYDIFVSSAEEVQKSGVIRMPARPRQKKIA
jgi:hypothetical protein